MIGKRLLSFVIIIFMIITMTSCKNSNDEKNNNGNQLNGKITVWSYGDAYAAFQNYAEDFSKKNPKVKIEVFNTESKENTYSKINETLTLNKALPDIIYLENEYVTEVINKFPKGFADLTDDFSKIKDDFFKNSANAVTVNGRTMALPLYDEPIAMFYRTDIFKDAEINIDSIKLWDDYIEAGKKLNEKTEGRTKMLAIGSNNINDLYGLMLSQLGTSFFDKDSKSTFKDEKSNKVIAVMKKIIDSQIAEMSSAEVSVQDAIGNDNIAAVPMSIEEGMKLMNDFPDQKGKWGVYKLPAFEPGGNKAAAFHGTSILISSDTKSKSATLEFAKYIVTDENVLINSLSKYGFFPSDKLIYDEKILYDKVEYFQNQKIYELFSQINKDVLDINNNSGYIMVKDNIRDALVKMLFSAE